MSMRPGEPRNGEEAQRKWGSPLDSNRERSDEEIDWWQRYGREQQRWGLGPDNADLGRARSKARRSDEEEARLEREATERQGLADKAGVDPDSLEREPEEEDEHGYGHGH